MPLLRNVVRTLEKLREGSSKSWYNEVVELGYKDGVPIVTFTHTPRQKEDVIPSMDYVDVIKKGIQETYPELSEEDIGLYLMERYLTADMVNLLKYLREQDHGVKITKICEDLKNNKTLVIHLIQPLKELGLIKQDGRTVREGIDWIRRMRSIILCLIREFLLIN